MSNLRGFSPPTTMGKGIIEKRTIAVDGKKKGLHWGAKRTVRFGWNVIATPRLFICSEF